MPLIKGFRQIVIWTTLSRILGMLRDMAFAYFLGTGGLAAATTISSYVQVAILAAMLRRRLGPGMQTGLSAALRDTIPATLCMATAVVAVRCLLNGRGITLMLLIAVLAGTAVFVTIARLLNIEMLSLLWDRRDKATAKSE